MRKFLWMVAVGALVVALAAPAMALDFKFSSSNRFRWFSLDGVGGESVTTAGVGSVAGGPFSETKTNNVNQGDVRFRPYFIVSDDNGNVQSHWRLEVGDTIFGSTVPSPGNSSGGGVGADGVNVETKWAFVDVALPFGIPARLRGGIQPYYLPKGLLIDDDGSGVRLYGTVKPISYDFWWLALQNAPNAGTVGTQGPANDDNNIFAGKIGVAIATWLNPYAYGVFRHGTTTVANNSESSDGGWFGAGATGKLGIVGYDVDFVWGSDGAYQGDVIDERRGWALDGGVETPMGPLTVGLWGMYATGDKEGTTTKVEDFPGIRKPGDNPFLTGGRASFAPKGSEIFWNSAGNGLFGGFDYQQAPSNTWTLGGYITYKPVKALTLKVDYFYIGAPRRNTNFYTGKSTIGHELALAATYQLWTGTKAWLLTGWVIPPDKGREPSTGASVELKTAQVYAFGVQHDF